MNFLIDPWLAEKDAMGCMADTPFVVPDSEKMYISMPIRRLPKSKEEILDGTDAYIITHIHPDHIDMAPNGTVGSPLKKDVTVFVQNDGDADTLKKSGFSKIKLMSGSGDFFDGIEIIKTPARHGTEKPCGPASGLILKSAGEPVFYAAGYTIW